jgi:predicted metal-dependent phosphotriesterase family hydrolase
LKTNKNTNTFLINSEFLQYNLSDSTLYTNQKVKTIFNEVLLESDGLKLITDSRGINAVFDKGIVQISNLQSLDKGYADKIILSSDDNILILDGKASFNQEGMIIKSDLIHYDYLEKKIIKSINSQIQNQI